MASAVRGTSLKRILLGLLAAVVLLSLVLLARAWSVESRQVDVIPADPLAIDAASAARTLAGLVGIPSISPQDPADFDGGAFARTHAYLAARFPELHAELDRERVADWSLLYTWRGRDPSLRPILLAAHLDVVPAANDEDWTHPPFAGVVRDGVVWGRGAIDDKGSIVALFAAATALLAEGFQPERTVYFALGHDEEIGGDEGAAAIAARLSSRGVSLDWVLDEGGAVAGGFLPGLERDVAVVGIAEKGSVSIALDLEAPGGHSSVPPPHTAIGDLSSAVVALEGNPVPAGFDGTTDAFLDHFTPELPFGFRVVLANRWLFDPVLERVFDGIPQLDAMQRTTTAVTIFDAGVKENILPPNGRVIVNFRIHPHDRVETVRDHVRRVVANERIRLQVGVRSPPRNPSAVSPVDGAAFTTLARCIRSVFPGAVVVPYLVLGGTDARHYGGLTQNVYRFLPFRLDADSMRLLHGTDERLAAADLVRGASFYAELLRRGAGAPGS
ncbi:MAG: peptidase M20 [Deltaproteobacteria bacterium]|nr:peptidase M20 [Deltaproteobacteria bacterium]